MIKIAPIHPFPARMAPGIAIHRLQKLERRSLVLDPMMGSGTVLRHAVELGHSAIGFDMDPLAVLMSRVWSTSVDSASVAAVAKALDDILPELNSGSIYLPWIDDDSETESFVNFWFAEKQRRDLRRLAFGLNALSANATKAQRCAIDVLKVALSRIIITKSGGASLAADVSHSRPHKVSEQSDFCVLKAFRRSLGQVSGRLRSLPESGEIKAKLGDARKLSGMRRDAADLILTSPPYLNAIDYMRGHKLSLVWLGHSISELRRIRAESVGAERRASSDLTEAARKVQRAMVDARELDSRQLGMVERYSVDLVQMMQESQRVLKVGGQAILVVGNSCLREVFIRNSDGVLKAGRVAGLRFVSETVRNLPAANRYLPMPKKNDSALGKRMRTESVITFEKVA